MTPTQLPGSHVLNFASILDDKTAEQAIKLSQLPFVYPHIALMPDAHFGNGSSVGTVIPTKGAVIPAAVGVDIGCGMIAVRTQFTKDDVDVNIHHPGLKGLSDLRSWIEEAIPVSAGNYNDADSVKRWFAASKITLLEEAALNRRVDLEHSPKWREQLGTLGGGNHFIEVCLDEEERVWLFLHSGSRGVGNKIAKRHIKIAQQLCNTWHIELEDRDHAYLPQGIPQFQAYMNELWWAQQFAFLNRAEMMDRLSSVFGQWIGSPVVEEDRINCHHNYTELERVFGENVWLTRKGAINAHEGVKGVIPGSMGTRSYVVVGKGNKSGLYSAPHGAGRLFSRNEARQRFTPEDLAKRMEGIEYRHGEAWVDEIPDAYKDIDIVMADAAELVEVTHTLRQILNVKGT